MAYLTTQMDITLSEFAWRLNRRLYIAYNEGNTEGRAMKVLDNLKVDTDAMSVTHQLGCAVLSTVAGFGASLLTKKAYVSVLKMIQERKSA